MSRKQIRKLGVQDACPSGYTTMIDVGELIAVENTEHQRMIIADTPAFGRALFLDGSIQSAEADEALYHETYVHPAVVAHGAVRRVFVGGTGEGAILRELLKHEQIEQIVAVDIDRRVVEACRAHLPEWHAGAFDDPRVELRWGDVRAELEREQGAQFDLVIMDVTEPDEGGPAAELFSPRVYAQVAGILAEGGVVVVQAGELDPADPATTRELLDMLGEVFASVCLGHVMVPSFMALWGVALCAKGPDFAFVPADLEARVRGLPAERFWVYDALWHRNALRLPRLLAERIAAVGPAED